MDNRCTIVTRLSTADGLTSEVYTGDTDAEQALVVGIIHDELAPRVIGRSAADPEGAWRAMEPSTNDILRDRGLALQAIACVDVAIWDVFGQGARAAAPPGLGQRDRLAADQRHRRLLPPRRRRAGGRRWRATSRPASAGSSSRSAAGRPAEDADARPRLAREALGPDVALMVDANQGYDRAAAVAFGRLVADLDIRWFEEPCRWTNDRRWMRDVRYQTGIPVCAGQSETTLRGIRDLIVDGAIDVSNFDASWSGGPTIWRKAAGLAAAFGVELGHHEEPQVAAPPAGERPRPHLRRVLRRGARPVLLAAVRPVDADRATAATRCPSGRGSASSSTRPTSTRTPSTAG